MDTFKLLLDNLRLSGLARFEKLKGGGAILLTLIMLDLAAILICNIAGIRLLPDEHTAAIPFWPLRTMALILGPFTLILTGVAFGIPDLLQELLPETWKNEIDTFAAIKLAAWLIGTDLVVLSVCYFLDPQSDPLAYTFIVLGTVILLYKMGDIPKSVIKSKK
jgi:hypothetical protein